VNERNFILVYTGSNLIRVFFIQDGASSAELVQSQMMCERINLCQDIRSLHPDSHY